jgi:hypothetical protein
MILKNISENSIDIDVNGAKVEIESNVKFSVRDTQGDQLLNMYPNTLQEVVILDEDEETPDAEE